MRGKKALSSSPATSINIKIGSSAIYELDLGSSY